MKKKFLYVFVIFFLVSSASFAANKNLLSSDTYMSDSGNISSDLPVERLWDGCTEQKNCSTGANDADKIAVRFDLGANYQLQSAGIFGDMDKQMVSESWSFLYRESLNDPWTAAFRNEDCYGNKWYTQNLNGITARYVQFVVFSGATHPSVQLTELQLTGTLASSSGGSSGSADYQLDDFKCSSMNYSAAPKLKFYSNFNNDNALTKKVYPGGKLELTSEDSRDPGGKAIKFTVGLNASQCTKGSYRSEITVPQNAKAYPWDDGKSYWIGVSLNPVDFVSYSYTLFQIHAPNPVDPKKCGWDGNSFTIAARQVDGKLCYVIRAIENGGISANKGADSNSKQVWKTPLIEGQWADFVVNFTLSSKNRGFFRAWYNGKLVYQKCGLTNVNHTDSCGNPIPSADRRSNGPHVGIYGPECASAGSHLRVLLADELSVAEGGAGGYDLVDPSRIRR